MVRLTVLVVDDDPDVLEASAAPLSNIGFRVLCANGGAQALRIFHDNPGVDLLFTDINMPEMTGWELAHAARQRNPQLRILLMSANSAAAPPEKPNLPSAPILAKPWVRQQLCDKLVELFRPDSASA